MIPRLSQTKSHNGILPKLRKHQPTSRSSEALPDFVRQHTLALLAVHVQHIDVASTGIADDGPIVLSSVCILLYVDTE